MWTPGTRVPEQQTGFTADALTLPAGLVLFEAGAKEEVAYLIEEGEIGLYVGEKLIARLGKESFVGAAALLLERPQPYSAKGLSPMRTFLKKYDAHTIRNAFSVHPELAAAVARSLDVEAAAMELAELDRESDATVRIARTRQLLKDRAARVMEKLGEKG